MSLIAGVGIPGKAGQHGNNLIRCKLLHETGISLEFEQHKHHRWKLDGRQIQRYGLSGTLLSTSSWWESCQITKRELKFFAMSEDIVICALICEDLARQEPAADLVRAVGPNLVVALLMDGPQLPSRWPACYASVLADDPGSSVLTVTNLGMVKRAHSQSPDRPPNTVALWKDAIGNFQPIEIADNHQAVVLNIHIKREKEWTADHRHDGEVAACPFLSNYQSLKVFGC